ncbi:ABC transporter ATP-binding protein [Limnobacter alexandrii]|uniref:ABC transporter ATP-binding protein n=1 Tax=Limnobacter alexandrii TaxID=2570352 RepID=UPI0014866401|nr:ABC transporter ATP-binding protein [Limnobacter alexandrii]
MNTNNNATDNTIRLHAQGLSFSWGERRALSNVSLDLNAGEMFGLLGPNGAGKTTLISLIAGLITPHQGELSVLGYSTRRAADLARKNLGFVFQSVSLDRFMTVEENLLFASGLQGMNKAQTKANLEHLYTIFPIQSWLHRTVGSLSGGQKRLVDIARAMVHKPGVLILDEPTTALDVPSKNSVWQTLKTLQAIDGLTIFVATHLMDEANSCDRVGFLNQGELSWLGTPAQALDELPDQSVTSVRTATLADWFVWKMNGGAH